ncbi:MAG TPA: hypothetical protein DDY88_05635 [Actinobacteria bacterium]|nr:hypothetical protein [Actinomycetota bacterium]
MQDWRNLAEQLIQARVHQGFTRRSELIRAKGISHDRVLNDIENARRDNYNAATLVQIEQWYGLAPGNVKEILAGGKARYADINVSAGEQSVLLNLPESALEGLSANEQAEVRAAAVDAALRRAREIRSS